MVKTLQQGIGFTISIFLLWACSSAVEFDRASHSTWQPLSEGEAPLGRFEGLIVFDAPQDAGGVLHLYDAENGLSQIAQSIFVPPTQRTLSSTKVPSPSFLAAACGQTSSASASQSPPIAYQIAPLAGSCYGGSAPPPHPTATPAPTPFPINTSLIDLMGWRIDRGDGGQAVKAGLGNTGPCIGNPKYTHDYLDVKMRFYNFRIAGTALQSNTDITFEDMFNYENFSNPAETSLTIEYGPIPSRDVACNGFALSNDVNPATVSFKLAAVGTAVPKATPSTYCPRITYGDPVLWQETYWNSSPGPAVGTFTLQGCGFLPSGGGAPDVRVCDKETVTAEDLSAPLAADFDYAAWLADGGTAPCYRLQIDPDYTDTTITAPIDQEIAWGGKGTVYVNGAIDSGITIIQNQSAVFNITLGHDKTFPGWEGDVAGGPYWDYGETYTPGVDGGNYDIMMYACDNDTQNCTMDAFNCPSPDFVAGDNETVRNVADPIGAEAVNHATGIFTELMEASHSGSWSIFSPFVEVEYMFIGSSSTDKRFYVALDYNRNGIINQGEPVGMIEREIARSAYNQKTTLSPSSWLWYRLNLYSLDYRALADCNSVTSPTNLPPVAEFTVDHSTTLWSYPVPQANHPRYGRFEVNDLGLDGWELVTLDGLGSTDDHNQITTYRWFFSDLQRDEFANQMLEPVPQVSNPGGDHYLNLAENSFTTTSPTITLYLERNPQLGMQTGVAQGYPFALQVSDGTYWSQKVERDVGIIWNRPPIFGNILANMNLTGDPATGGANVQINVSASGINAYDIDAGDSIVKYEINLSRVFNDEWRFYGTYRTFSPPVNGLLNFWLPSGKWYVRVHATDSRGAMGYSRNNNPGTYFSFSEVNITPTTTTGDLPYLDSPYLSGGFYDDNNDGFVEIPGGYFWLFHPGESGDPITYYQWITPEGTSLGGRIAFTDYLGISLDLYPTIQVPVGWSTYFLFIWDADGDTNVGTMNFRVFPSPTPTPTPVPPTPPVAVATELIAPEWNQAGTEACLTVTGTPSYDPDGGTIAGYAWSSASTGVVTANMTGAFPRYCFTTAGSKTISLIVTDDEGATSTSTAVNTSIPNPPTTPPTCIAIRTSGSWNTKGTACTTYTANLSGASSHDNDEGGASIVSYVWSGSTSGTGVTKVQTYTTAGVKSVTLTCTDDEGQTGVHNYSFLVPTCGGPPPEEEL